ncbi:MAG TPA: protein kinase [Planctomycetaceae bacterium]
MPSRITLTITEGKLKGQEFVFGERTTCIVGRARDCVLKLPSNDEHRVISRHHCLLDINPPDIRVRDFGSLNGTYVNGRKIGQREGQAPQLAASRSFPEHDLKDGDEVTLGRTVFRIGVHPSTQGSDRSAEIPDEYIMPSRTDSGAYQGPSSSDQASLPSTREQPPAMPSRGRQCAKCGRDVTQEIGPLRVGDYICRECQADLKTLLEGLLSVARSGRKELASVEDYVVEKELGRGGMGAVFLARHARTGARVALKVMLPRIAAEDTAVRSFLRETENTKALHHRHVVELRDSGCSRGVFFLTLEYCDGGSVDKLMKARGGKLTVSEAGAIMLQVLDGLAYAHQAVIPNVKQKDGSFRPGKGLVHRDLKPHNIFLMGTGQARLAKIGDYGLSKAFDQAGLSGHTCTAVGTSVHNVGGTPVFMAREQVRNFKYARPDVDVWAAAACLYNMLTGAYPREFSRDKDCWQTLLECNAIPILKRDRAIPRRLAEVIDAALVEEPRIGFSSAVQFKRALEGVL